ncbi:amidohydrolase family protein [Kineococcus sp. SYSU DK003]|uniref:amidohydrolase family protein n=1 Tax=Kineococcus sp. SYSU DK003 TaxID=3383124 RepID=UPI003D7D1C7C
MSARTTLLRDVVLVDVDARRLRPSSAILVRNGRIAATGPVQEFTHPVDEVVDGGGAYAVPGLIDAHIHLRASAHVGPSDAAPTPRLAPGSHESVDVSALVRRAQTFLWAGVTSVFDAGNNSVLIRAVRAAERSGDVVAPRIHCTGNLFTARGGHGETASIPVDDDSDIPRLVAEHASLDPDVVKITYDEHGWGVRPLVPVLRQQTLARLIAEVHRHGRKVTVHVSHELRARQALDCGADVLAHPVIQSPVTDEFTERLSRDRIPVVSTLTIGERYHRLADAPEFLDQPFYRACEEPEELHRLRTQESVFQRGNRWADWMRVMTPVAQANIAQLVQAGGVLGAGTDQSFGPDFHRELELLAAAGLSTWQVLRAATTGAAAAIDRSGELGTFDVGAHADVLLVAADPVADVAHLRQITAVFKGGQRVDRDALDLPVNRTRAVTA